MKTPSHTHPLTHTLSPTAEVQLEEGASQALLEMNQVVSTLHCVLGSRNSNFIDYIFNI